MMPRGVRFHSNPTVMEPVEEDQVCLVPQDEEEEEKDTRRISEPSRPVDVQRGPGRRPSKRYKIAIAAIGGVVVVLVLFAAFSPKFTGHDDHHRAVFNKVTRRLLVYRGREDSNPALELAMANGLDGSLDIHGPYLNVTAAGDMHTYQWRDGSGSAVANMSIFMEANSSCVTVAWVQVGSSLFQPSYNDCIALGNSHWYGGGEMYTQNWPLEEGSINSTAFVSHDIQNHPTRNVFGSVLQPLFLSSNGVIVTIDDSAPLFVSLSSARDSFGSGASLCLQSRKDEDIYPRFSSMTKIRFSYSVCFSDTPANAYRSLVSRGTVRRPSRIPDVNVMRKPIWATGGGVKTLNQANVAAFADEIATRAPSYSVLQLDNKFVQHYGDFVFDNTTFPNPGQLFSHLKARGFNITLWESLFVNVDSANFDFAVKKGYLVRGSNNQVNLVKWWNGVAGVIDVTSVNASNWYLTQLKNLQQLGVDSFQFHGGEVEYLPLEHVTTLPLRNPNAFSTMYASKATDIGGKLAVTRTAYQSQELGHFVALMDKYFTWGLDNGLHSVLTSTLTLSILGYPFVIPDVVAANVASGHNPGSLPDAELYIRWAQLTAFLPVMQLSTPPWWYADSSVEDLTWKAVELHGNLSVLVLENLAINAMLTGEPIVRPLWWIAPTDEAARTTNTQFLVGSDIMVVAVVKPLLQTPTRSVYIPTGRWQHCNGTSFTSTGQFFTERLYRDYIPYFCRLSASVSGPAVSTSFCSRQPCR